MKKSILGSSVNWEFTSADGTPVLSGTGRCRDSLQNKESGRFDDNPWNFIKNEIATLDHGRGSRFRFGSGVLEMQT